MSTDSDRVGRAPWRALWCFFLTMCLGLLSACGGGGTSPAGPPEPPPPLPTLTSFAPTSGAVGTTVTLTGTGFTGATAVRFAGTPATSFTVISATQITATVPSGAASGAISVTTPGGTASSSGSFVVTSGGGGGAPAAPTLSLSFGIKETRLSWTAPSAATFYRVFESADGVAPLAQVGGDITATAFNRPLALHRQLNAQYKVQACNSQGCTDSATLTVASQMSDLAKLRSAVGYVKASNTGAGDFFGYSVALSADGNTLAVGAQDEASNATGIGGDQTNNSASKSGAVYVFSRSGSTWSQQAYVKASNTGAFDSFGASVALSADGNTLAVGAPYEASNATGIGGNQASNSSPASGAVYVFSRSGSTWLQQAYVKASNTEEGDSFGNSVALSADGNTLAVGADREDSNAIGVNGNQANNSLTDAGAVYVFSRSGTSWSQQAYVKASNTGLLDWFGRSVALSADGNTLAVGARHEDSNANGIGGDQTNNSASNAGAVYVYSRSGTTWSPQAYVKASNTGADDSFGDSVALSADGNTLAVGALYEDSNATGIGGDQTNNSASNAGAVYLY